MKTDNDVKDDIKDEAATCILIGLFIIVMLFLAAMLGILVSEAIAK